MKDPTAAQIKALQSQDKQTLAEWWCELNSWYWPDGLPDFEPPPHRVDEPQDVRWACMQWIAARVDDRTIFRTWNKDMPDDVFDSFRRGDRGPGTPYGDWCQVRTERHIAAMRTREDEILSADVLIECPLDADIIG